MPPEPRRLHTGSACAGAFRTGPHNAMRRTPGAGVRRRTSVRPSGWRASPMLSVVRECGCAEDPPHCLHRFPAFLERSEVPGSHLVQTSAHARRRRQAGARPGRFRRPRWSEGPAAEHAGFVPASHPTLPRTRGPCRKRTVYRSRSRERGSRRRRRCPHCELLPEWAMPERVLGAGRVYTGINPNRYYIYELPVN